MWCTYYVRQVDHLVVKLTGRLACVNIRGKTPDLFSSKGLIKRLIIYKLRTRNIIRTLTETEAQELFVVIGHLEGLAARLSLGNIQEQDIAAMKMHISMMNAAIMADDVEMYLEVQDKFHNIYLNKCANRTLSETLERLKNRLFRHHYQAMSKDERKKFLLGLNDEHTRICELFAMRDSTAIERYLVDVHWNPAEAVYEVLG